MVLLPGEITLHDCRISFTIGSSLSCTPGVGFHRIERGMVKDMLVLEGKMRLPKEPEPIFT